MKKIPLNSDYHSGLTVMVFVEGTILKPKSWLSLYNHKSYIPIGNAVEILKAWQDQDANLIYITSRKGQQADEIANLLKKYDFPGIDLVARDSKDNYQSIVEKLQPDILVEDNCRSIGGSWQMCITKTKAEVKDKIASIVVPEFKGIDHLLTDIKTYCPKSNKGANPQL